jgi:hypothetical protein
VFAFLVVVKDGSLFTTATVNVRVQLSPGTGLPVTWLYFKGQQKERNAVLTWATASEVNAKEFVVERSLDGRTFRDIGTVAATGNSTQTMHYSFVDKDAMLLPAAAVYYRLRQIDRDNRFAHSVIVLLPVKQTANAEVMVQAYPNPFARELTLLLTNVTATDANDQVTLYTADGKAVYRRKLVAAGNTTIQLADLPALTKGLYLLQVTINGKEHSIKVLQE